MPSAPDCLASSVPPEKDPQAYSYVERRADLLDRIIAKGSPRAIHQGRLAGVYDVSESQVSQNMDRLAEDIHAHLTDSLELATLALYEHTVEQLHDQNRYKQAWDVHMEWVEFAAQRGAADEDDAAAPGRPGAATADGTPREHELSPETEAHLDALAARARGEDVEDAVTAPSE
jgi:hypothetical protein